MAKITLQTGQVISAPDGLTKDQYDEIVEDATARVGGVQIDDALPEQFGGIQSLEAGAPEFTKITEPVKFSDIELGEDEGYIDLLKKFISGDKKVIGLEPVIEKPEVPDLPVGEQIVGGITGIGGEDEIATFNRGLTRAISSILQTGEKLTPDVEKVAQKIGLKDHGQTSQEKISDYLAGLTKQTSQQTEFQKENPMMGALVSGAGEYIPEIAATLAIPQAQATKILSGAASKYGMLLTPSTVSKVSNMLRTFTGTTAAGALKGKSAEEQLETAIEFTAAELLLGAGMGKADKLLSKLSKNQKSFLLGNKGVSVEGLTKPQKDLLKESLRQETGVGEATVLDEMITQKGIQAETPTYEIAPTIEQLYAKKPGSAYRKAASENLKAQESALLDIGAKKSALESEKTILESELKSFDEPAYSGVKIEELFKNVKKDAGKFGGEVITPQAIQGRRVEIIDRLKQIDKELIGDKRYASGGVNQKLDIYKSGLEDLKAQRAISDEEAIALQAVKQEAIEMVPDAYLGTKPRLGSRDVDIVQGRATKPPETAAEFVDEVLHNKLGVDATSSRALNEVIANNPRTINPAQIQKTAKAIESSIRQGNIRDFYSSTLFGRDVALTQDLSKLTDGKFGSVFENIWVPLQEGSAAVVTTRSDIQSLIRKIAKDNNIPTDEGLLTVTNKAKKSGDTVYKILETISDRELLTRSVEDLVALYPQFQKNYIKAAKEYRPILKAMHERMNQVRLAFGDSEIKGIDNYITHVKRTSAWNDLFTKEPEILKKVNDGGDFVVADYIIAPEKQNPFLKKRLDKIEDLDTNFFSVIDNYIDAYAKEIYIKPQSLNIRSAINTFNKNGYAKNANFWNDFVKTNIIGMDSSLLKHSPGGRKVAETIRLARIRANLLGNISFNLVTQPASTALTFLRSTTSANPLSGIKNTALGYADYMLNRKVPKKLLDALGIKGEMKARDLAELATSMRIKTGRGTSAALKDAANKQNHAIYRSRINKLEDITAILINLEEKYLQGGSILAGLRAGEKLGYKGKQLRWFQNNVGEQSQSMYDRISRPMFLNSDVVRTAWPFQTFAFELNGTLRNVFGKSGMSAPARIRVGQALSAMVGFYIFNKWSEAVRGRTLTTPGSFVPLVGGAVDSGLSTIFKSIDKRLGLKSSGGLAPTSLSEFFGVQDISKYGATQTGTAPEKEMARLASSVATWAKTGDPKYLVSFLGSYIAGAYGIGGGAQAIRFADFAKTLMDGEFRDKKGKKIFELESPMDVFSAFAAGPYSAAKAKGKRKQFSEDIESIFEK